MDLTMLQFSLALLILLVPADQSLANMDRLSELTIYEAKMKWAQIPNVENVPEARSIPSMQRQVQEEIKLETPGMTPDTAEVKLLPALKTYEYIPDA